MLPCVRAADALWDKVFLTGTCVLGGQESKTVFWARNLKPSLPSFVNLCFLLFKITDSRILQTACTVHQCFMFILSVLCCFSSGGELPDFVFPLDCLSSYQRCAPCWLIMQRTTGPCKSPRQTVKHHSVFIRTSVCSTW